MSNITGEKISSTIKRVFDSKMFFLGQHHLRKTTLEDVLQKRPLQPKEGLVVALQVAKAISTLHRTGLVHGQLCLQHVFVSMKKEVTMTLKIDF